MSAGAVAAAGAVTATSWSTFVAALSPTIWWRLAETSGTTAADSSGNSRPGTYANSPTLGATGATADGNKAVTLDGLNDKVSSSHYPTIMPLPTNDWSIAFFIKYTTTAVTVPLTIKANTNGDAYTTLQMVTGRTAGYLSAETWSTTTPGSSNWATSTAALNDGNWHHVVITFSNATRDLKLYVDGSLHSTKTQGGSYNTNDRQLTVGYYPDASSGSAFFPGSIDEVIVKTGTIWTPTQIADLYAARLVA